MKNFIEEIKKEYSMIVTPSLSEVVQSSSMVIIIAFIISLSIAGVDFIIGSVISAILMN